jgi:hypothetical protein
MADYGHDLAFGTFITPLNRWPEEVVALARLTERAGLDLVTFQDHPLGGDRGDGWPAAHTRGGGGRPRRGEAIEVIRAIWDPSVRGGGRVDGQHYRVWGPSAARSRHTTSRSGSARTSRGCCASSGRRRTAGSHPLVPAGRRPGLPAWLRAGHDHPPGPAGPLPAGRPAPGRRPTRADPGRARPPGLPGPPGAWPMTTIPLGPIDPGPAVRAAAVRRGGCSTG